jgi:hypothetical protein
MTRSLAESPPGSLATQGVPLRWTESHWRLSERSGRACPCQVYPRLTLYPNAVSLAWTLSQ